MSQQRPVIDSLEFARQHKRLDGRIAMSALPRLADALFDTQGELGYTVAGSLDQAGAAKEEALRLSLDGALNLICQRCLGPLPWAVRIRSRLVLVAPGSAWPDDELQDDRTDPIEATAALDVLALLEDELLLALPIAPVHAGCQVATPRVQPESRSPFATLAGIKRNAQ